MTVLLNPLKSIGHYQCNFHVFQWPEEQFIPLLTTNRDALSQVSQRHACRIVNLARYLGYGSHPGCVGRSAEAHGSSTYCLEPPRITEQVMNDFIIMIIIWNIAFHTHLLRLDYIFTSSDLMVNIYLTSLT